jgi:NADH-quinone oxidoreductase subunit C
MAETQKNTLLGKEAVLDGLPEHPALTALVNWNNEAFTDAKYDHNELTLTIVPEQISAACETLRSAGYEFFEDMTGVDWFPLSPRYQLSYHLLSFSRKERIRLRVMIDDPDPAIETITGVWPAANFYEREVFDLFGVRFEGHPNLRRIMMPDDWKGHPLRKDYPVEGYR